jgi:APA family basic amino acid/polyamine antiporter
VAIVIAFLGLGTDWRPYVLLAGWLVIGMIWYAVSQSRRRANEAKA